MCRAASYSRLVSCQQLQEITCRWSDGCCCSRFPPAAVCLRAATEKQKKKKKRGTPPLKPTEEQTSWLMRKRQDFLCLGLSCRCSSQKTKPGVKLVGFLAPLRKVSEKPNRCCCGSPETSGRFMWASFIIMSGRGSTQRLARVKIPRSERCGLKRGTFTQRRLRVLLWLACWCGWSLMAATDSGLSGCLFSSCRWTTTH